CKHVYDRSDIMNFVRFQWHRETKIMARKGFLVIVVLAVLCIAILTVPASAAPTEHSAAKAAQPSNVVQGNVYLITNSTSITALNATTGALLWQFQPGG